MINPDKANSLYAWNERFPPIVNLVYGWVWKPDDPETNKWYNHSFTRSHPELAPTSRKLIQLAFHDCLKYSDGKGNSFGGCDGCLNWDGMDFLNEIPRGNMAFTFKVWPSYRTQPVTKKTNNNKLSTTVFALEWLYRVPNWPPGAPELPQSLWSSGKSRADLWQLAANVGLEIEMARANYGCTHKVSHQQMLTALEGKENCFWRLHKPIPFQYGRADCVRDEKKATTKFPFAATEHENHANPFGQGDWVLKELKRDFGMSARQTIAMMAAHGISTHAHNKIIGVHYRWAGAPFISNLYFKTLGSRPQYNLGMGLALKSLWGEKGVLLGDKFGRPLNRDIQGDFTLHTNNWWNTSFQDSGPWFFRPMTVNADKSFNPDLLPRLACFSWNNGTGKFDKANTWNPGCKEATINEETGVQTGGPHYTSDLVGPSSYSFTFYLPYEVSFVMNFTVDEENHPRGCNIPDVYPECEWGTDPNCEYNKLKIKCGRTNFKLPGESQSSADIVEEFGDNHGAWAKEFLEGWQMIQKNGYDNTLKDGPESSWLGYSLLPKGSDISFPLLFTENLSFDLWPYMLDGDDGLGTLATS